MNFSVKNKRLLTISNCNDCPHFSNHYASFEERCRLLNRVIISGSDIWASHYPIPDDCPLEKPNENR